MLQCLCFNFLNFFIALSAPSLCRGVGQLTGDWNPLRLTVSCNSHNASTWVRHYETLRHACCMAGFSLCTACPTISQCDHDWNGPDISSQYGFTVDITIPGSDHLCTSTPSGIPEFQHQLCDVGITSRSVPSRVLFSTLWPIVNLSGLFSIYHTITFSGVCQMVPESVCYKYELGDVNQISHLINITSY